MAGLAAQRWLRIAERNPAGVETVYRAEQAGEIIRRVQRIGERLYPVRSCPHGFFEFPAFIERARERDRERAVLRGIHARMAEKVRNRDRDLTIEEKALRIAARERPA